MLFTVSAFRNTSQVGTDSRPKNPSQIGTHFSQKICPNLGRIQEGAKISDIRVKEGFKPKTKDTRPKAKGAALTRAARRQMLRQIKDAGKNGEAAEPSMQEVEQTVDSAVIHIRNVTEQGRDAFQRQTQKRQGVKARKKQLENRFSRSPSNPSYPIEPRRDSRLFLDDNKQRRPIEKQCQAIYNSASQPSVPHSLLLRGSPEGTTPEPKTKPSATIKTRASAISLPIKTTDATEPARIKTAPAPIRTASRPQANPRSLRRRAAGARNAAEPGRRKLQRDAQRKLAVQAKQAAKRAAEAAKEAAAIVARAFHAMIGAVAAGGVGVVLLAVFLLIAMIAAVIASPFGVFFSGSGPDTVPLSSAVAEINAEYCAALMELQTGDYDEITLSGSPPDWTDVIAVFACVVASDEPDATDVATMDRYRIIMLKGIFWSMCEITSEEVTVEHPDLTPEDETDDSYTTTTLFIYLSGKTAEDMRTELDFDEYQNNALDELLAERESLRGLLGDLTISDELAAEVWHSLPPSLSPERTQVIRYALSLVGKVNYFWGGKSRVLGWDSRWGQLQKVWAEGSETTGTYRPYGLDCSGFVDWVFYNASNGETVLSDGGGVTGQHANCTEISWDEAQPGDLVFYADNSHVGIVAGQDENGNLRVIHCNSSANTVSISGPEAFFSIGRPVYLSLPERNDRIYGSRQAIMADIYEKK